MGRLLMAWDPNPHHRIASEKQACPVFAYNFILKIGTWKTYIFIFKVEGGKTPEKRKNKKIKRNKKLTSTFIECG